MTIDSTLMILWMTVTAAMAWLLPKRYQVPAVIASTFAFLFYRDARSPILLTMLALMTYACPKRFTFSSRVLFVLIALYAVVFIVLKTLTTFDSSFLMPLGFSFYSFRIIHYLFEGYKDRLPPHNLTDFLAYLFFLPTLITGPIHRFPRFKEDLDKRRLQSSHVSCTLERILYGYIKILVLGNYLMIHRFTVYMGSIESSHPGIHTYLSCLHDWLNLYFQFSGYADIAIGFSILMGFTVMENFNYPFLATNITDFWGRWHISLSSWIRDYMYAPLAAATRQRFVAIAIAMLVFGLWHEFSTRYIFWGLYHAFGIAIWHQFQKVKQGSRIV